MKLVSTLVILFGIFCQLRCGANFRPDSNRVISMEKTKADNSRKLTFRADRFISARWRAASDTRHMWYGRPMDAENDGPDFNVVIDLDRIVSKTGPKFVGVALDSIIFRSALKHFNVFSKKLHSLAQGLAPSFIRVGGTAADFFIFSPDSRDPKNEGKVNYDNDYEYDDPLSLDKPIIKNYTVTREEWKLLNYFVQEANWDLIFDFNEFLRHGNSWDPTNARELLSYSQENNYSIPCFQLGNEPNSYRHNFNFTISGDKLASDMRQLRSLLSQFPIYQNSIILGPDVTKVTRKSAARYLKEFLQAGGKDIVAAATLHHYYFNVKDKGAGLNNFINATFLNSLKSELDIGVSTTHSLAPGLPVWLSETSSVSGGGLPGASDRYVAGFMWLDKLGLSAMYGIETVIRQSLYRGGYALLADDFTPYPDYFLTLLYKRLVQGAVFRVTTATDSVRMYASCSNPATYQKGALTVYVLNVKNESTTLNFTQFAGHRYELYLLTPGDGDGLRSAYVALNGNKLVMEGDQLPPLPPLICSGKITIPAYSFGFVVIPQANERLCLK